MGLPVLSTQETSTSPSRADKVAESLAHQEAFKTRTNSAATSLGMDYAATGT